MRVATRNPLFRIRMITQKLGEFDFDTTHGSVIEFTVHSRMGDPAGAFSITLVPRKLSVIRNAGGWQDVISTMDFVEIWAWVPPRLGPLQPSNSRSRTGRQEA